MGEHINLGLDFVNFPTSRRNNGAVCRKPSTFKLHSAVPFVILASDMRLLDIENVLAVI